MLETHSQNYTICINITPILVAQQQNIAILFLLSTVQQWDEFYARILLKYNLLINKICIVLKLYLSVYRFILLTLRTRPFISAA